MIKTPSAKTAKGKRALKKMEPKLNEDTKCALFLKANKCSQLVTDIMKDLAALKKPDCITLSRKNNVLPFEDETDIEYLMRKNDCSLFMLGSHNKKRPHNITIGRTFDGKLLDMMELAVCDFKSFLEFGTTGCGLGKKPVMIFSGGLFATSKEYKLLKNIILDFFHGQEMEQVALNGGLEHVIGVTALEGPSSDIRNASVLLSVYKVKLITKGITLNSTSPRVELQEMGPRIKFRFNRTRFPDEDTMKQAYRQPAKMNVNNSKNSEKNKSTDITGEVMGKIHVGQQDLGKLQTRKVKGLKRKRSSSTNSTAKSE